MIITADIAMYPLHADYEAPIIEFIHALRHYEDLDVVTHQMSTQVRGKFDRVMTAINASMKPVMADPTRVVFVVRYLNIDLDIAARPDIG